MCKKAVEKIKNSEYTIETVKNAADLIYKDYKNTIPVPIVKIVNDAGFSLFMQDLPKNIGGYISYDPKLKERFNNDKIIVSNINNSANRRRFTVAHELGHFLLDPAAKNGSYYDAYENDDEKNDLENLIDRFAAELLMPAKVFIQKYREAKNVFGTFENVVEHMATYFLVPKKAVEIRIREIISE